MLPDFEEPLPESYKNFIEKAKPWISRLLGASFIIGLLWGFSGEDGEPLDNGFKAIVVAIAIPIIIYIVITFLYVVISFSVSVAYNTKSPFLQGIQFVLALLCIMYFFDLVMAGGQYLVWPTVSFLQNGTLEGTFWNCNGRIICPPDGELGICSCVTE